MRQASAQVFVVFLRRIAALFYDKNDGNMPEWCHKELLEKFKQLLKLEYTAAIADGNFRAQNYEFSVMILRGSLKFYMVIRRINPNRFLLRVIPLILGEPFL